jgi:transposase
MSQRRLDMHKLQELVRLHRLGTGCREVARLLSISPNTERGYRSALNQEGLLEGMPEELPDLGLLRDVVYRRLAKPAPQHVSSLEPWRAEIEDLFKKGAKPRAIYDKLRLDHQADFTGSYSAVKRLYRHLVKKRGIQPGDVAIPVETLAGEVAQVDFGYVGRIYDPKEERFRKAWVFVMVLGHSRHMFARLTFDQKTETWLRCHVEAFDHFGGVPKTVVPDNLKAAVIKTAFAIDSETSLNRSYRELARHFDFTVDPTPVYSPEKKGKVESAVKYVKNNFFATRDFEREDARIMQSELARWVLEIAGTREHGSTGRRPLTVFEEEEQQVLKPLPSTPYELIEWRKVKVHRDTHVQFDKRLYSVPWKHVGKQGWVRATPTAITVYVEDERVAAHSRIGKKKRSTVEVHLPEERALLRHRSREFWEGRAAQLGASVGDYVREVFESDDVLSKLRTVQAIVRLLEAYPVHRARAACERGRYYGCYTYMGVKKILLGGHDMKPLPSAGDPPPLEEPRHARSATDFAISARTGRGGAR